MNWSNEWLEKPAHQLKAGEDYSKITLSIIVNPGDFPTTVEAIQIGDLAVHHDIKCKKEGFWQVTHVPTLTRFNVVPHGLHKQADLIQWCKNVQASFVEDWKELAKLDPSSYSMRSEAKDRIMVLCQGTKVGE